MSRSLLDEPLLGIEDDAGRRGKLTLPGLLARLSRGEPTTLTGVQAHQQHAVHAFLVQLAAIALAGSGTLLPDGDEKRWGELLVSAAERDGAGPEAFALVVSDLSRPAFLQPPVPEGTLDALHGEHSSPCAELDVLITAKNHDVKVERMGRPSLEHWVYALITLQTMQGFLGAGNYGIARMNGGFGSRPCVAFASGHGAAERFRRDTRALADARSALGGQLGFGTRGALSLVWCAPWDGAHSLTLGELDPFFIEICRRVRLTLDPRGGLVAHRGSSRAARIVARESSGNTGDPWTPIARQERKALTMTESGFGYERVQELLFQAEFTPGAAGDLMAGDRLWLGQVLVRGQGKTGGYHERWVDLPPKVCRALSSEVERSRLGELARGWVDRARVARLSILKPALLTLLQGSPEVLKFDDDRADGHLRRLDAAIDDEFFPMLFELADSPRDVADRAFEERVYELAKAEFVVARDSLPVPSSRRWRCEAHAHRVLRGAACNHFKLAFPHTLEGRAR